MIFNRINHDIYEFVGTSGANKYVDVAPADLVEVFGTPDESDGFKVSGEYTFRTSCGSTITLYDWKSTSLYDEDYENPVEFWHSKEERTFNIGACTKGKKLVDMFIVALTSTLNSNARKFIREA